MIRYVNTKITKDNDKYYASWVDENGEYWDYDTGGFNTKQEAIDTILLVEKYAHELSEIRNLKTIIYVNGEKYEI